jgi:hypothetical protein
VALASSRVNRSVAVGTKGNEIAIRIIAQPAPALDVVDLESAQGTASLAAPTIPFEDLLVQPVGAVQTTIARILARPALHGHPAHERGRIKNQKSLPGPMRPVLVAAVPSLSKI